MNDPNHRTPADDERRDVSRRQFLTRFAAMAAYVPPVLVTLAAATPNAWAQDASSSDPGGGTGGSGSASSSDASSGFDTSGKPHTTPASYRNQKSQSWHSATASGSASTSDSSSGGASGSGSASASASQVWVLGG